LRKQSGILCKEKTFLGKFFSKEVELPLGFEAYN